MKDKIKKLLEEGKVEELFEMLSHVNNITPEEGKMIIDSLFKLQDSLSDMFSKIGEQEVDKLKIFEETKKEIMTALTALAKYDTENAKELRKILVEAFEDVKEKERLVMQTAQETRSKILKFAEKALWAIASAVIAVVVGKEISRKR